MILKGAGLALPLRMTSHDIAVKTLGEMESLNERVARLEADMGSHKANQKKLEARLDFSLNPFGGGSKVDAAHSMYNFVHEKVKAASELSVAGNTVTFKVKSHTVTVSCADPKAIAINISGDGNNSTMTYSSIADAQKYLTSTAPGLSSCVDIRQYTSAILRQQSRTGLF